MSLIKSCDIHGTVYYRQCRECLHDLAREEKAAKKAEAKRKAILSKPKKVYAKPNKVSDKRKELNKEYSEKAEAFKNANPICRARIYPVCTRQTEDIHHQRGRGKYLLDESTWMEVCRNCHIYIENHPEEAKEKGWSESRLAIDQSKPTI